ncbi:MAG: hypothetical protein JNJ62_09430 [Pseudoxanthomonas mexicana]|nr:hypothetical protein [Pseudoxanthomonas mexicana]
MRSLVMVLAVSGLTGCATLRDRPAEVMVVEELAKEKKLVHFSSALTPEQLREKATQTECGKETKVMTSVVPVVGVGFVGVGGTYEYTVHSGVFPDGVIWVALRTDGTFHGTAMGYTMKATEAGRSEVTVYAADKRKTDDIRMHVEAGTLFCHWRDYSYPYD